MPIIALLQNQPLGNVPAPVLDHQRRPTVDTSEVSAAALRLGQIKNPELPESLAAPAAALGSIGRGIEQGGSVLGALAVKQKEAAADVQVATADNSMLAGKADFEGWKLDHPDPSEWAPEWEKRLTTLKQTVLSNPKLDPTAAEHIGLRMTRFEGQSKADVMTSAAKETFSQAKSSFLGAISSATDAQDRSKFDEALSTSTQKGYVYGHEAEALKQNFEKVGERKKKEAEADAISQAKDNIVTLVTGSGGDAAMKEVDNPRGMFSGLAPADKEGIRSLARQVSAQRGADAADMAVNGVLGGKLDSAAAIDAVDNPNFTPKLREEAKQWVARRSDYEARQALQEDKDKNGVRNAVAIRQQIKDYDPKADPDRTEFFKLKQAIGESVSTDMAGELNKDLAQKYGIDPPKVQVRPEIEQNITKSLGVMFDPKDGAIPWRLQKPVLDAKGREVKDSHGNIVTHTVVSEAARQRALDAEARIEMKMQDWYRDNPEKKNDFNAVKKHLMEVLPEGTRAGALEIMQKKLAPPPQASTGAGQFRANATGYFPVDPGSPNAQMEGGHYGASEWHGTPVKPERLHTLEDFKEGKAPYVSVAMDNTRSNPLPYGTILRSPQFPGVPFRVMDTGSAFNGDTKKYGGPKGLSRIDIAHRNSKSAGSYESNRGIDFEVSSL
jgi:hypothetical protein